jgi:hypothetical protein
MKRLPSTAAPTVRLLTTGAGLAGADSRPRRLRRVGAHPIDISSNDLSGLDAGSTPPSRPLESQGRAATFARIETNPAAVLARCPRPARGDPDTGLPARRRDLLQADHRELLSAVIRWSSNPKDMTLL